METSDLKTTAPKTPETVGDQHLLERLRAGDRPLLGHIYQQHRHEFLYWITRTTGCNQETARDVYQDTFVALHENVTSGRLVELRCSLKTYLFSVGRRIAAHRLRRRVHLSLEACAECPAEASAYPREEARRTFVDQQLSHLAPAGQTLLRLFYYDRLSMQQIAQQLGYKNECVAKTAKARCMKKLRFTARQAYALVED